MPFTSGVRVGSLWSLGCSVPKLRSFELVVYPAPSCNAYDEFVRHLDAIWAATHLLTSS